MLGLMFRAFENFIRQTYGGDVWLAVLGRISDAPDAFEPLFPYDMKLAQQIIEQAAEKLEKPQHTLLEDFGTFLVTNPRSEHVRRLLRFGGADYQDFLHSLEDLRGRANLAVPDLDLPQIELSELPSQSYVVCLRHEFAGFGHVLLGVLRALADDYGALAILDSDSSPAADGTLDWSAQPCQDGGVCERLTVQLVDMSHGEAKEFQLSTQAS